MKGVATGLLPVAFNGGSVLRFFIFLCFVLFASEALASRVIEGHETWSGKVAVDGELRVPHGASLTVQPGTELSFSDNAALIVEGRLSAKGTAEEPIVFRPDPGSASGSWQGITFQTVAEKTELEHISIEGAANALSVSESMVNIVSSTLRNGNKGVVTGIGARITLERVTVRDMSEGAIEASVRSQVQAIGCRIENVTGFGIQAGQQAKVLARENRISQTKFGILVSGDFPPLEGNILEHCELGIGIAQAGPGAVVRGNKVAHAKTGIACQQFASPTIERNSIEDCEEGITCVQGASPTIQQNRLARNSRALSCVQMCYPKVSRNDFVDNATAAYLHLSSYAQFQENNFEGNRLHIELDNMSYDWEVRAGKKPTRNRQMQSEVFMQRGRTTPETPSVAVTSDVTSEGFVNAKGNYWGRETTLEMNAKGPDANISTIRDAFDVPTRTYEGWPGEYKQDRVRYDGWKKARIAGTGP